MTLLTPLWLLLLAPWAVACVWAGRGVRPAAGVPFLPLWPPARPAVGPRRPPPLWAMLLLTAAFMTIAAAAGPVLWRPPKAGPPVTVRPVVNAGIDQFAVVAGPHPQAMVGLFNGTDRGRAVIDVDGVRRSVDLPPAGQKREYFLDLPGLGATTGARLLTDAGGTWADDLPGDDRATLTRTTRPVRIDPRTPLSPVLARFAAVYARHRAEGVATFDRAAVAVVRGEPPAAACVIIAGGLDAAVGRGTVTIDAGHPVSRSLGPDSIDALARTTAAPPGDGWRALVRDGTTVLLAARERPARQVWVGFDSDALADSPAFVLFWADVFDWIGGGEPVWTAPPAAQRNPVSAAPRSDVGHPAVPLSPALLIAALALVAAGGWLRGRLTRF